MNRRILRYLRFAIHGITRHVRRALRKRAYRGPARDPRYLAWIRLQPSVVSGNWPCEAAHTGSDGGIGIKASDTSCIPLTHYEHCEYHQMGRVAYGLLHGLDFVSLVKQLNREWRENHAG